MAVATHEDVSVELGRPLCSIAEQSQVEWWLTGVEMLIRARLGDIAELDQDVLKYVEVAAVAAKVRRNGTSESSITVAVDDGSVTRRYENAVSGGDITDEWWEWLSPSSQSGAFSTRPGFEPDAPALESWA